IRSHPQSSAVIRGPLAPAERTPPDFESRLDHVALIGGEDDAQLIAYDSAGEVVGSIGLWADPDGRLYLTADYEDGYAETVITDSRVRTEATLALEVIARRTE